MELNLVASIVAFFQKGGMFMYPILFVFAAGMAISMERWIQLGRVRSVNRKMWTVLQPILAKGEFDKARQMVNKDKSTISQMLAMGLARQGAVRRRDDIEIAMEESIMEIIPQLEKRTPYVALLSVRARRLSRSPNSFSSSTARFLPTLGTPGTLSELSPSRDR